jgi:putative membrane protein
VIGTDQQPWLRLDPRMLLVHPAREVVRFLPVLVGILLAGGASGAGPWGLVGVGIPIALGLVRYLTTSYRITGGRVELRRGLLQRHLLSAAIDRVRTVDLTATLAHRVLGLATVVIGTGSVATDADERLELDGLPREQAAALRTQLLQSGAAAIDDAPAPSSTAAAPVVRFEPRWLWYAPFTSGGLVAAAALIGVLSQTTEMFDLRIDLTEDDLSAVTGVTVVGGLVAAVGLVAFLAVAGYLVVNGGFLLTREGGAWHIRRGLVTTRETSLDEARVAGVTRGEPAALRLARGARLSAIVTGLARSGESGAVLVPPAPRATVAGAAAAVLGTSEPMTAPLRAHGPAATRRRYSRALLGSAPVVLVILGAVAAGASAWLLVAVVLPVGVALALARDRARSLGHGLVDRFVVTRSGSLLRHRDALATGHVIGWTFRDSWFQRRAGLVTLDITTAGGKGRIGVPDVRAVDAIALADAATPGLVAPFLK